MFIIIVIDFLNLIINKIIYSSISLSSLIILFSIIKSFIVHHFNIISRRFIQRFFRIKIEFLMTARFLAHLINKYISRK